MTEQRQAPIVVETTRGSVVENRHLVSLAMVDADGHVIRTTGVADVPVPARSTLKPLQALALLRSGAADELDVGDAEVAIASASHNGEPGHVELVTAWLARLGLGETDLRCAPALPRGPADVATAPSRIAHNCSGKHTGFLAVARHLGVDPATYLDVDGPVQRLVLDGIADACRTELTLQLIARDGCSAPAACVSLEALGQGLAHTFLAGPDDAAERILDCMATNPWLVGGTGRFDTELGRASAGRVVTKAGAAGMHVAIARDHGIVVAAKCQDGSRLPVELALADALAEAGALPLDVAGGLVERTVHDDGGHPVGELHVRRAR